MAKVCEHRKEGALLSVSFRCPGCGCEHCLTVNGHKNGSGATWSYNGNTLAPTLSPSVNSRLGPWPQGTEKAGKVDVCHFFLTNGRIQFLGDCTHAKKGQTLELPDLK